MFKYPSVDSFRRVVDMVNFDYDEMSDKVITFNRTTKCHGTNCSIVLNLDTKEITTQSRNIVISQEQDHLGFSKFVHSHKDEILEVLSHYQVNTNQEVSEGKPTHLVVYGEWCGSGIKKGIGLSKLPKMFVIFDACLVIDNNEEKMLFDVDFRKSGKNLLFYKAPIYSIVNIDSVETVLNFNDPLALQEMLEKDAQSAEDECPVAKWFGKSGIGEGYVYTSLCGKYKFKTKGDKHKVTKVRVRTPTDLAEMERASDFVDSVLLTPRLEQGVDYLKEIGLSTEIKNMSKFIQWVIEDVKKEEGDTMDALALDVVKVNKEIANVCRNYFKKLL